MPVLEKDTGIHWATRKTLKGFPSFTPVSDNESNKYQIPLPPVGVSGESDIKQPDVEWQPHSERPYDNFGNLWRDRRPDPDDPTS